LLKRSRARKEGVFVFMRVSRKVGTRVQMVATS
jgi:hypothetical protein